MRTLAELEQLDFAFIDELSAQEQKLGVVEQRLAAMETRRGQVPEVVFQRVHDDYLQQRNALRLTVEPLRQRARQMAGELGSLQAQFRLRLEEGRLALTELDFRHSLGEFDAAELTERKRPLLEPQAGLEQALRRVEAAMQKLAHSSSGADALAAQQTQETPVHAFPPAAPLQPATTAAPIPTPRVPEPPPTPAPAPPVLPPTVPPAPVSVAPPLPPAVPTPPPVEPKPAVRRDATFVFKPGRLLPQSAEAGSEPRTLGMRPILVGSQVGCDVVVADLAPRHVEFRLGRSGFIARDVSPDSRGFRINGVPSEGEVLLADGDTIDIGPARFVLKA
jgi:hypothetical protein